MESNRLNRVLLDLCHAYASATDTAEAAGSAVQWVRAAVGRRAAVRLLLLEGDGRLRLLKEAGHGTDSGRKRSGRRREAIAHRRAVRLTLRSPEGHELAILPLICRGDTLGVLEVMARSEDLEEGWDVMLAIAAQTAIVLRNVRRREELQLAADAARDAATPMRRISEARSANDAVRAALAWCEEHFDRPVAAWLADGDPAQLHLFSVRGLGSARRKHLRSVMGSLARSSDPNPSGHAEADIFAEIAGVRSASVIDVGEAVVMIGTPSTPAHAELLDLIASMLGANLQRRAELTRVLRRDQELDQGIALTAHEFRGPLLGARAAIELLVDGRADGRTVDLLRRSGRELEQLAHEVDGLLRWAVGKGSLRRRLLHVGKLMRDVASACELEDEEGKISIAEMEGLRVWADRSQMRSALANVVRNALEYSPAGAPVRVSAERNNGTVTLSVRDRGPGIPPEQREAIFDPFVRATDGSLHRADRGLGLFIARRVVEAHGGRIWVESNGWGATFRISLPAGEAA